MMSSPQTMKIDDLLPAAGPNAENAALTAPGAVAGPGKSFDQQGDHK